MIDLPAPFFGIELSPYADVGRGSRPTSVYVARGDTIGLIGAGHIRHRAELEAALADLGIKPSDVTRVVSGSWTAEALGGARAFPNADLFVASDDGVRPRRWGSWLEGQRARWLAVADEILSKNPRWDREPVVSWAQTTFAGSERLDFIPLHPGHRVRVGAAELQVLPAPGPHDAHAALWCQTSDVVFAGALQLDGLPTMVDSAEQLLASLEVLSQTGARMVCPTNGRPSLRGADRQIRFCNNYLTAAPQLLSEAKTALEVTDADLGFEPDNPVEYIEAYISHRAMLDELAAIGVLHAHGNGLERTYRAA